MSEINLPPQSDLDAVVSNPFGEHSLFAINRNTFQKSDASSVFRSRYGDSLFKENTFYIIAGTDSGLLYQYVKQQQVPKGSRYLFVELAQVLDRLTILDDPQEDIVITRFEDWFEQASKMDMFDYSIQDRMMLQRSLGVVHGHYSDYPPFWRELKAEFDVFMGKQNVGINARPFTSQQINNLTENQTPAIYLTDAFKGKTAVLLAGGPSLDLLIPWVRQHRHNLLVIAVSRISHSLLQADIQPDICVSVDPHAINLNVSKEMFEFQDSTLLVNEYHLNSNLLSSWGGKKAFTGPRYPWSTPLEPTNLPASVGSTVTNNAFSLAMLTGVAQLVLGGADFCYSQTGYTHASGSAEHALGPRPMHGDKRVTTNSGMMADTHNQFLNSARTINLQAEDAQAQGCRVINPAPGSMRLSHIEHIPLADIQIEPLEKTAREIIGSKLPAEDNNTRVQFYNEVLGEVDRILTELRTIKTLSLKALDYNRKLFDKNKSGVYFYNNTKLDNIEKQLKEKYASTAKFIKHFGLRSFIPILSQDEQHEENSRLYFQAFIDTANELTDMLHDARRRTLCRLEEEKPQPNVMDLIKQWRHDQQPGRAIQWAQRHADYVQQLPEQQQQALRSFQNSFDDSVKELNEHYLKGIESSVKLDGLSARAKEYFQCGDQEGLQNLQASLNEHSDQQQAEYFLPLVTGYLAELNNDTAAAITAYQSINEGPTHIDALMRLFGLHTQNHELDSALHILKALSCISPTYTPMYADLLQATGDVNNAVEIYTEYLLSNPDDLHSVMKLGQIYHQYDSAEGVEWAMNYILDKDPDNQTAQAMLKSLDQPQTIDK